MSSLPKAFCWTKYGIEAGQSPVEIFARKELERLANNGVFLWGIGNSISGSLQALLKHERNPKVVFSPMLSKAKTTDKSPAEISTWSRALTLEGNHWEFPAGSIVTSRAHSGPSTHKKRHYALVCKSDVPLELQNFEVNLDASNLRNLATNSILGASQVTAIVRANKISKGPYAVTMVVDLIYPYFVRLTNPIILGKNDRAAIEAASSSDTSPTAWNTLCAQIRDRANNSERINKTIIGQGSLFNGYLAKKNDF